MRLKRENRRYDDEQLAEAVRRYHAEDATMRGLARELNISLSIVQMVVHGEGCPRYKAIYEQVKAELENAWEADPRTFVGGDL